MITPSTTEKPMTLSEALHDREVLNEMRHILRSRLNAALILCHAEASKLAALDPDEVMAALRAEFDPLVEKSPIQDCFTDGFHKAMADTDQGQLLTGRKTLPSGAAL